MVGTALAEFQMRPECSQPHVNGSAIHAQMRSLDLNLDVRFLYEEVASVPFWSILTVNDEEERKRKDLKNKIPKKKVPCTLQTTDCEVWRELNAEHISIIVAFLNLKEKSMVRLLNKT
jgi:hypothetical protein